MRHNTDLDGFQEIIGYRYKDVKLLINALTHSSYANEKKTGNFKNNERLEFLGDAVLEVTSSDYIYRNHSDMDEGQMTRLRASIVCEPTLALCAKDIKLSEYIMLGKGEEQTGGRKRASIISDAFEALIGSIYLDGGFASAKEFVHRFIMTDIEHKKLFYDSKTILQEQVQKNWHDGEISYVLTGEEGPDHDKTFLVDLYVAGEKKSSGKGRTKKAAEQDAAYRCLINWKEKQE